MSDMEERNNLVAGGISSSEEVLYKPKNRNSMELPLPKPQQYNAFYQGTTTLSIQAIGKSTPTIQAARQVEEGSVRLHVTSRRWAILILYTFTAVSNSLFWVTFSPIIEMTEGYYNIGIIAITRKYFLVLIVRGLYSERYFKKY